MDYSPSCLMMLFNRGVMLFVFLMNVSMMNGLSISPHRSTPAVPQNSGTVVQLVGSSRSKSYEGVVEVFVGGMWYAICDSNFGKDEADVVCRQMGYRRGARKRYGHAAYEFHTNPYNRIAFGNLDCNGREVNIDMCRYYSAEYGYCFDGYSVAGVECFPNVDSDGVSFRLSYLGWILFFLILILTVGLGIRLVRQRRALFGGRPTMQQSRNHATYNTDLQTYPMAVQQAPVMAYQVAPPGSYSAQPAQPNQFALQGGVPSQVGCAPYPQQGGVPYPSSHPHPSAPPIITTSNAVAT